MQLLPSFDVAVLQLAPTARQQSDGDQNLLRFSAAEDALTDVVTTPSLEDQILGWGSSTGRTRTRAPPACGYRCPAPASPSLSATPSPSTCLSTLHHRAVT